MTAEVLDFLILLWLVATWFYEGHHRRCKIEVVCPACGKSKDECCRADELAAIAMDHITQDGKYR